MAHIFEPIGEFSVYFDVNSFSCARYLNRHRKSFAIMNAPPQNSVPTPDTNRIFMESSDEIRNKFSQGQITKIEIPSLSLAPHFET